MPRVRRTVFPLTAGLLGCLCFPVVVPFALPLAAQQEKHGRGYKPMAPTAEITVTVQKAFNQKPLPNASVIFRAEREGKLTGNLETKTDPDGHASLDLLEVGSHVTVQVIAGGYATFATDFDLTKTGKQVTVKLERPRAQVSQYGDNQDRPAVVQPGIQEHQKTQSAPSGQSAPAVPTTSPQAQPTTSPLAQPTTSPQMQVPQNTPETQAPAPTAKPGQPQ